MLHVHQTFEHKYTTFMLFKIFLEKKIEKMKEIEKIIQMENDSEYVQGIVIVLGIESEIERIGFCFKEMCYIVYQDLQSDSSCLNIACLIQAAADSKYPDNIKRIIFYFAGCGGSDRSGKRFIRRMLGTKSEILPIEDYVIEPLRKLSIVRIFLFDCYQDSFQKSAAQLTFLNDEVVAFAYHKFSKKRIWTTNLCENLKTKVLISAMLNNVLKITSGLCDHVFHCEKNTSVILSDSMTKFEWIQAFEQAINENGSICCSVVHCLPFGPPRVGKTHFYHLLLNIEYIDNCSTGVADEIIKIVLNYKIRSAEGCVVKSGDKWGHFKGIDQEILLYLETIRKKSCGYKDKKSHNTGKTIDAADRSSSDVQGGISEKLDSTGSIEDDETNTNSHPVNDDDAQQGRMDRTDDRVDDPTASRTEDSPVSFPRASQAFPRASALRRSRNHFASTIKVSEELQFLLEDSTTMFYTDTGGQPEFQEVLPCLVGGPTLFLLVFNLSIDLDKPYKIEYIDSENHDCSYESTFTTMEVLMQYLITICSYFNGLPKDDRPSVKILVLATHRDEVSEQRLIDVKKVFKESKEMKQAKDLGLLVTGDDDSFIFPINNNDNENDGKSIRKIFMKKICCEEIPKCHMPVNWLGFEFALRKRESSVISLTDCRDLAKQYYINESDFPKVLDHLHKKMGVIRYYDTDKNDKNHDTLKKTVITKPVVLFKAITKLIVATFDKSDDFKKYGLFYEKDVEKMFLGLKEFLGGLECKYFLAFLDHFNILIPAKGIAGKDFDRFLPCALKHVPEEIVFEEYEEYPLILSFCHSSYQDNYFVPIGFFSSLLGFLCKKEWSITERPINDDVCLPNLYRNQAILSADADDRHCFGIKVQLKQFHIEFTIRKASKVSGNESNSLQRRRIICRYVYNLLNKNAFEICAKLQCTHLTPIFGMYCSHDKCSLMSPHFAMNTKKLMMRCFKTKNHYNLLDHKDEKRFWFEGMPLHVYYSIESVIVIINLSVRMFVSFQRISATARF